jgi:hypothetical protein
VWELCLAYGFDIQYGGALGLGTVHIVTVFEQRPAWLAVLDATGAPSIRLVKAEGLGDAATLLRQVPDIAGLAEEFLLWSPLALLGKTAHRSDFWMTVGGWGPRLFPDAPLRPVPVSRRALQRFLAGGGNRGAAGYVGWLSGIGLVGAVLRGPAEDAAALEVAQSSLQEALRLSYSHTFVFLVNELGVRLPPLQAMLEQRWSAKTGFEL